jgi:hypothetical protein
VPGGLSVKLVVVVAAFAFVGAFRIHAGADDAIAPAATTLTGSGASALASDTSESAPISRAISAPALSRVAALPALHRAPARPRKAAKHAPVAPAATVAPTPVPTVAPTVPPTPTRAPSRPKSYVGESFDSKG